ncbi:MAG: cysteine synthase family protein [Bdellovibrionota bacterium]
MKHVYNSISECIGNTPIVKLQRMGKDLGHDFYVKLDFMNPGSSIKDRLARQLIEDAVASGQLKKSGTIIETTSGNTGMGLAMIAATQGYKCVFTMPDKVSSEKTNAMRALGAEVILCPTAVEPEDERSYYSVAKRLARDTPNSIYLNQYDNPANTKAHYLSTGPEIYEQMGNDLDYLVACIGTGGTLCGSGKYLKEKNPKLKTLAVDPIGSIFYDYFKTGKVVPAGTYKVEGFGEDFFPKNVDFKLIDDMVQVNDQECFDTARELARTEGIFGGGSCGAAISAAFRFAKTIKERKTFLILLPDGGSRYLSKFYNDDWMIENGFLKSENGKNDDQVRF